jgi:S-adenosylmethionine synthetase
MTAPITALANGRLTPALGGHVIPVEEIIDSTGREFLGAALPLLDTSAHLVVQPRVSRASSPGAVLGATDGQQAGRRYWFTPRSLDDLAERHRMFANDTSAGVGYAPLGTAEQLTAAIETHLTSPAVAASHPYYGTDIKLMVVRRAPPRHRPRPPEPLPPQPRNTANTAVTGKSRTRAACRSRRQRASATSVTALPNTYAQAAPAK